MINTNAESSEVIKTEKKLAHVAYFEEIAHDGYEENQIGWQILNRVREMETNYGRCRLTFTRHLEIRERQRFESNCKRKENVSAV